MSNYLNQIVHLTEAQYLTLISNGTITVGGQTIIYNPDDLYVTSLDLSYTDNDSTQGDTLSLVITHVTLDASGQISVEKMPYPVMIKTTAEWGALYNTISATGTILIYSDHDTTTVNSTTVNVPAIKIADGSTPIIDLPFVSDDIRDDLLLHIADTTKHITAEERSFWNNKINCNDTVLNNNLILTRN